MANALYAKAKQKFLDALIDLPTDTIKVSIVDGASYTPNLSTHEFFSDLAGVYSTSFTLASKTITDGVFDAADVSIGVVSDATTYEYAVIWKDTGTPSTSPLICLIDSAGGIPITFNGGNYGITWHASGIFAL